MAECCAARRVLLLSPPPPPPPLAASLLAAAVAAAALKASRCDSSHCCRLAWLGRSGVSYSARGRLPSGPAAADAAKMPSTPE